MARLKTVKLLYNIYQKLMDIPGSKDVNDAIKKLFYTLQNDAERAGAEQIIEENKKRIEENKKKIELLPKEKEEFLKGVEEKFKHKIETIENKRKIVRIQLENLEIKNPRFAWETHPEWIETQRKNLEMGLKSLDFEEKELRRDRDRIMDEEKHAESYDILRTRLIQQNERLQSEIERFERIIALCDKLNIDYNKEGNTDYIG